MNKYYIVIGVAALLVCGSLGYGLALLVDGRDNKEITEVSSGAETLPSTHIEHISVYSENGSERVRLNPQGISFVVPEQYLLNTQTYPWDAGEGVLNRISLIDPQDYPYASGITLLVVRESPGQWQSMVEGIEPKLEGITVVREDNFTGYEALSYTQPGNMHTGDGGPDPEVRVVLIRGTAGELYEFSAHAFTDQTVFKLFSQMLFSVRFER